MKYAISRWIPVRFSTIFTDNTATVSSTWWQWGDRVWAHKQYFWPAFD